MAPPYWLAVLPARVLSTDGHRAAEVVGGGAALEGGVVGDRAVRGPTCVPFVEQAAALVGRVAGDRGAVDRWPSRAGRAGLAGVVPVVDGTALEGRVALEGPARDRERAAQVVDGAAEAVERRVVHEVAVGDGRGAVVVEDGPAVVGAGVAENELPVTVSVARVVDGGAGAGRGGSCTRITTFADAQRARVVDAAAGGGVSRRRS